MELPTKLSHTFHKSGGQIMFISKIAHRIDKPLHGRSRDEWFFIGEVKWNDGGTSKDLEIAPYSLCYLDEANKLEVNDLCRLLNDYLRENGEWFNEGKHQGWYANRSNGG